MDNLEAGLQRDSASNSIDIASPRLQEELGERRNDLKDHLEMSSKITQTELQQDMVEQIVEKNGPQLNHKTEDHPANSDREALLKKAEHHSKSKAGKRILINLDDKNRFTDEITV